MSAELRARVLAAVAAESSPTRAAITRRATWISVAAAASAVGVFVICSMLMSDGHLVSLGGEVAHGHRVVRPVWLVVATVAGALGVAVTAVWLALSRGRSMLGRSRGWLLCGAVLIPISLFAWKVLCSNMASGDALIPWPTRPGLRCLSLSLLVAVGPLVAFLAIRRAAPVPVHPALNGAVLGFAAGACAWVAVDLWCPVASVSHLLLGHVLPLFVLAGVGALLGQALLSLRRR